MEQEAQVVEVEKVEIVEQGKHLIMEQQEAMVEKVAMVETEEEEYY